jgi:hypothetical protein
MSIVHWGDVHMSGRKGRPLLHQHLACGKTFDPVMVCSECGEPLDPKRIHVHRGPGASGSRHLPPDPKAAAAAAKPASRPSARSR